MIITREQLTPGQLAKLNAWELAEKPIACVKLGYSIGSRGNSNFHSTWIFRDTNIIERIGGDSRSTWRRFVRKYGIENVG